MPQKPTYEELEQKVKELDKRLEEAEYKQLWGTYSQSPIPTLILTKEGKIVEYNGAMAKLTGYAHEEVPDIEVWMPKIYPEEEYRNKVIEISRKSRDREIDVKRDEFIITTKAGDRRHIAFSVFDVLHEWKLTDLQVVQGEDITKKVYMEEDLKRAHDELEQRVKERTAELVEANEQLKGEIEERKQAEETLRASEERYAKAEEIAQFGYYERNLSQNTGTWSKEAYRIFGENPDQYQPTWENFLSRVHPSDREPLKRAVEESMSRSKAFDTEYRIIRPDGSERLIHSVAEVSFDERGQPTGLIGTIFDITDRKQAEEALRESEATARALINSPTDAIALIDTSGILLDINETMARGLGRSVNELIGLFGWDLIPPGLSQSRKAFADKVIQSGKPIRFEDERQGICYDNVFYPVFDAQGDVAKIAVIARDITERKQAEEALKRREEMLSAIIDQSPIPTAIGGSDGSIMSFNEALVELIGYRRDEITDITDWANKLYPDKEYRDFVWNNIQQALRGEKQESTEFTITCKDRSIKTVDFHTSFFKDGLIIQMVDITERKQAEEKIKASLKENEVLLSEIHHRVKNNMQIISSLLKLQAFSLGDERVTDALMECRGRVQTMAFIHETLYGSDTLVFIDFKTYISKLASQIFQTYKTSVDRVKLKVDADDIKLGLERATPLGLIVNELLSNSLKYAFPENRSGEIVIRIRAVEQDSIEFVFSDNGIGIPEALDWRNTDSLGLQLVIILAEDQLDGTVSMDRRKGTHFIVRFRHEENQ